MELKELIRELNLQVPWENIISCKEVLSGLSTHSHILRATHKNSPWSCAQLPQELPAAHGSVGTAWGSFRTELEQNTIK